METMIRKLSGANMDIDLCTPAGAIEWRQDACPWNQAEGHDPHSGPHSDPQCGPHRCAVKNISICPYFCGIAYLDQVLCSYPHPSPYQDEP